MATSSVRPALPPVRCAIYTRKSTEEGLEQEFNSLDAQRAAAEAYIVSQQSEGWSALPYRYDDGGFTGANMDRPALGQLLRDIAAGRIDCVVVYKVDRLSRSLLDFARILGEFEKQQVSFVSVTQQFNTRAPVGRLTLHILLSFAQFEREIIGERTRDKKAAARRQGKWTGGYLPLGYDLAPRGGKLLINEPEAAQVRAMFRLFADTGSLEQTLAQVHERGWSTKGWVTANGKQHCGSAFTGDTLRRLLSSELYRGAVRYQGTMYRGEQPAIVDQRLWTKVRNTLERLPAERRRADRNKHGALLKGLLHCALCDQTMQPVYSKRGVRCYGYYVCPASACRNRLAARSMEESVVRQLARSAGGRKLRQLVRMYEGAEPFQAGELIASIRRMVKSICYDPQSGAVTLRLQDGKGPRAKTDG